MRFGGAAVFCGCVFPARGTRLSLGFRPQVIELVIVIVVMEHGQGEMRGQVLDHVFSFLDFETVVYASEIHAAAVATAFPADAAGAELVRDWSV